MSSDAAAEDAAVAPVADTIAAEFEEFGLSPYEARVLVALLALGSANSLELTRLSRVPRTSTYQVLESLGAKGLAQRVPGPGAATWAAAGRDEVLSRLVTAQEERLRQHKLRAARVQELMATALPEAPAPKPPVRFLSAATQLSATYEQLMNSARSEILMFSRPPFGWMPGGRPGTAPMPRRPSPLVLAALARGVSIRVLYQAEQVEGPGSKAFRDEMTPYHDAGMVPRVVHELPVKLAVFDAQAVLFALLDPAAPDVAPATHLLVEHPGFSGTQVAAFEQLWRGARSFPGRDDAVGDACPCAAVRNN